MEGLSLDELIEFYDARDLFLGLGPVRCLSETFCIQEGFRRLSKSRVPEAVRVCSFFAECGPPNTAYWARQVLETKGKDDLAALCYAGILLGQYVPSVLFRAAEGGHALAMAIVSTSRFHDIKYLEMAEKAAAAGERSGWNSLGLHFWNTDRKYALMAYEQAARLGHVNAMWVYGQEAFSTEHPDRYYWMGKACRATMKWAVYIVEARRHLEAKEPNKAVLLMIGRMINGRQAAVERPQIDVARTVVQLYTTCIQRARNGVLCWLMCARKKGLYRDVSQLVASLVWDERHDFLTFE